MSGYCSYYIKTEVFACKEEINERTGKKEFRVFHSGGSCKSDIEIKEMGLRKLKIKPMGIDNKFFMRVIGIVKMKKQKNCKTNNGGK